MASFEDDFLREFSRMRAHMNALFSETGMRPASKPGRSFTPPVDVYETQEGLCVCMEIAGMKPEDLQVRLKGRLLSIEGRRRTPSPGGARVHHMEIDVGRFRRVVELPAPVDEGNIQSRYENGLLVLHFQRPAVRRVEVDAETGGENV